MTMRLQRYDFGNLRDFRAPLVVPETTDDHTEEAPPPPPPPTFSEAELDAARALGHSAGHAEGYAAGLAHAAEQAEQQRLAAEQTILNLSQHIVDLPHRYEQLLQHEAAELSQLVLMIAKKVTDVTLNQHAAEAVTALLARCLPVVLSKPQLIVELNPAAFETTMNTIETHLQQSGFEGEVQFRSNAALGIHDAVLDWGTGQANRSTAGLWQEIEQLLANVPVTLSPLTPTVAMPENIAHINTETIHP